MSEVLAMLQSRKPQDEWMTPDYAVYPLAKYLKPKSKILCPFDTKDSAFVRVLSALGHEAFYSHIIDGVDFFDYRIAQVKEFDYIISNPPFSRKAEVFECLFYLGRPFAMLQGVTTIILEGERFDIFKDQDFEIMWLRPRVNYIRADGVHMKGVPFQSCYVCHDVLPMPHILERFSRGTEMLAVYGKEGSIVSKECKGCGKVLPLEKFHTLSKGRGGRTSRCKDCVSEIYRVRKEAVK